MMKKDPEIGWGPALVARGFQLAYPAIQRAFFADSALEFASRRIVSRTVRVETRHGGIDVIVYAPTAAELARLGAKGERVPVHVLTHGGAYITRTPGEEGNVARYLASEVGCYVVLPDYHSAPQVRFPVAEEECFDVFAWTCEDGARLGWDTRRISVGGPGAGAAIALAVALMAIDFGVPPPVAVTCKYGVADMTRSDAERSSPRRMPVVSPALMRLVRRTYLAGIDLGNVYSSPLHHPRLAELPPVLVLTAALDTLRHEANDLADRLRSLGVQVAHTQFPGVDHGFTRRKPVAVAREAIAMIGDHLSAAYAACRS